MNGQLAPLTPLPAPSRRLWARAGGRLSLSRRARAAHACSGRYVKCSQRNEREEEKNERDNLDLERSEGGREGGSQHSTEGPVSFLMHLHVCLTQQSAHRGGPGGAHLGVGRACVKIENWCQVVADRGNANTAGRSRSINTLMCNMCMHEMSPLRPALFNTTYLWTAGEGISAKCFPTRERRRAPPWGRD